MIPLHRRWFIYGRKENDEDEYGKIQKYTPIPGGIAMGHDKEKLEKLFTEMEEFAKYCFCSAHSMAYAYVAYITAWFAFYYPVEYYAALLNSVQGNLGKVSRYINFCRKELNIEIVEPDINVSTDRFLPTADGKIAYSLNVKYASENVLKAIQPIRDEAPFTSLIDFMLRTSDVINKQTLEALISIGAFSKLGVVKSQVLAGLDDIVSKLTKVKAAKGRATKSGKLDKFDFSDRFQIDEFLPNIKEIPEDISLRLEKKYLGLYLTGNPLYKYTYSIKTLSNFKTSDIEYEIDEGSGEIMLSSPVRNGQKVRFIGMINELKIMNTKKKQLMAIVQIEDLNGIAKMIVWPQTYERIRDKLKVDGIYKIEGNLMIESEEVPSIICDNVTLISEQVIDRLLVHLSSPLQGAELLKYIKGNSIVQGHSPLYMDYDGVRLLLNKKYWVNINKFDTDAFNTETITW